MKMPVGINVRPSVIATRDFYAPKMDFVFLNAKSAGKIVTSASLVETWRTGNKDLCAAFLDVLKIQTVGRMKCVLTDVARRLVLAMTMRPV